ncbi:MULTISPECIES: hypothetical protein [unclassified Streptomyces]|uniref:hypothetical protein n=1 Tax=Streptomycetaceae TaxID=2062 RepID=UPI002E77844A|nr:MULTISPECIES: hypothetical protein [unclassified Streptomyces]MED7954765.1 hypothetical protein [Streptomyces sp. BE303]MEE1827433.1 hypothetical protein [Streptomyces sp. BE20]
MPRRPTPAQFVLGVFTVVAATVALLAATGAEEVPEVAVVVVFSLALGTLVTVLSLRAAAGRADRAAAGHGYARQR